jgi:4-amino-4-deoxy-L-arabinose transferase-like glycosyltransferase
MRLETILAAVLSWNRRTKVGTAKFVLVAFLCAFTLHVGTAYRKNGTLDFVPPQSDQADYDCIAVQIYKLHGFCRDYGDPDYQAAYKKGGLPYLDWLARIPLYHAGRYPTTYRPPALPALIAATHWAFGRQFWAIRIINATAMAGAVALVGGLCLRAAGLLPAVSYLLLILSNSELTEYSTDILTESLAAICVAGMAYRMQSLAALSPPRSFLALGALAGSSILVRTNFALWLPLIAVLIFSLSRSRSGVVVFVASALILALPWFIRNCVILHTFMPMGAQGMIELPAGFSDEALRRRGNWHNLYDEGYYRSFLKRGPIAAVGQFDTAGELRTARHGQAQAVAWIRSQPLQFLQVTLAKPVNEWRLYRPRDGIRLLLFLVGSLCF